MEKVKENTLTEEELETEGDWNEIIVPEIENQ